MYRTLSEHITNLLKKHSCVILPGLGGFVTNYKPAVIDPKTDVFSPPSMEVAFNPSLTHNDGLLLEEISIQENVTVAEAELRLAQRITSLRSELYANGSVELDGVGLLYLDKNLKISFRPALKANLYPQSYGLKSFRLPSIKNRRQSASYEFDYMTREKNNRITIAAVAAASIVVILTVTFFINQKINNRPVHEAAVISTSETLSTSTAANAEPEIKEVSTSKRQALLFVGNEKEAEYHIIAASFSSRAAAEKALSNFTGEGMHAQILEDAQKFRISIFTTNDKYEALRQLDFYRLTVNNQLWLLTRLTK